MGAGGVEVAQQSGVPLLAFFLFALFLCFGALGVDGVGDDALDRRLRAAVHVGGADGAVFGDGDHVLEARGVAVDGGRGGEDDVVDIVLHHRGEEGDGASDVGAVVCEGDLARLANGLVVLSVSVQLCGVVGVKIL